MTRNTFLRSASYISNYYPHWGAMNGVSQRQSTITLSKGLNLFSLGNFSKELVDRVAQLILSDQDQEVRLEALHVFSDLAHLTEDPPLIRKFLGMNQTSIQNVINIRQFESGIVDSDWRIRRAWTKFSATQINNGKLMLFILVA